MDFGIARDESGTMTSGLVPGTLDYMPPEVVASESRGDASTDIYALGLCFYEALTGKTVYPRLPGGQEGYLAFFERSKRGERPKLDESAFEGDADLLDLVKGMIEPDPARRISSAAESKVGSSNLAAALRSTSIRHRTMRRAIRRTRSQTMPTLRRRPCPMNLRCTH